MSALKLLKRELAASLKPFLQEHGFVSAQPKRVFPLRYLRTTANGYDVIEFIFFPNSTCKFRVMFRPIHGDFNKNIVSGDESKLWDWVAGYKMRPVFLGRDYYGFSLAFQYFLKNFAIARTVGMTRSHLEEVVSFLNGGEAGEHLFKSPFWDAPGFQFDVLEEPTRRLKR